IRSRVHGAMGSARPCQGIAVSRCPVTPRRKNRKRRRQPALFLTVVAQLGATVTSMRLRLSCPLRLWRRLFPRGKHHVPRHPRSSPNLRSKPLGREPLFQIRDPSLGHFKTRAPMPRYATFFQRPDSELEGRGFLV